MQQLTLLEVQPVRPVEHPWPDLREYDWLVISSSAGKDSQAMLEEVSERAAQAGVLDRVVVVHCDLGRVEWPGTAELAEAQAARHGVRFVKVWRRQGDLLQHIRENGFFPKPTTRYCTSDHKRGQITRAFTGLARETAAGAAAAAPPAPREGDLLAQVEARGKWPGPDTRYCTAHHKTGPAAKVYTQLANETAAAAAEAEAARDGDLLGQVEARGMWPSPQQRYCTSDQKRAQVDRLYTALATTTRGKRKAARRPARILSCQGMRAEESPKRAKLLPFERDKRATSGNRIVDTFLPLHAWTVDRVWERLRTGKTADLVHYAYSLGMPRVSCCFCIFSPRAALLLAGKHNPELLAEYVRVEATIDHTFKHGLSLKSIQDALHAGEQPALVADWRM